MAMVGFIALLFLGMCAVLAGGYFMIITTVFSRGGYERVIGAVILTIGVVLLWLALKNGPISVSVVT